jgi:hypothetical protein
MVDVYSKMKPDAFMSQLHTVLTAYYEDIEGVVSASGCTKAKIVKRKFEDQEDTERVPDADAADAAAATPAIPPDGGTAATSGGRSLHRPPALGARAWAGAARGGREWVVLKRLPRPKADAD